MLITTYLKTLKVRLISDLQKLEDKRDDKIKVFKSDYKLLQQQITALTQQKKKPSNTMM